MAARASCNRATFTLTRHGCSAGLDPSKLALDFSVRRVSFQTKPSVLSFASLKSCSRFHSKLNAVGLSAATESFSIARVVESLINKTDLSEEEAEAVLDHLLREGANDAHISVLLVLLRAKGETYEESEENDEVQETILLLRQKLASALESHSYQSRIADNFTVESAEREMYDNIGARTELVAEEDSRGSCEELRGQMLLQVLFLTSRRF